MNTKTGFCFSVIIYILFYMFYTFTILYTICNGDDAAKCANDKLSIIYSHNKFLFAYYIPTTLAPFIAVAFYRHLITGHDTLFKHRYYTSTTTRTTSVYDGFLRHTFYLHNGVFINVGNIFRLHILYYTRVFVSDIIY